MTSSIDNYDEKKEKEISMALMKTCWKLFKDEEKEVKQPVIEKK